MMSSKAESKDAFFVRKSGLANPADIR
jgi:hypothetical protein